MRPHSINRFEQFYLASTAIAVFMQVLNNLGLFGPASHADLGPYVMPMLFAISYGLAFVIWYLIARRASNITKWVLVAMTVLTLLAVVPALLGLAGAYMAYMMATAAVLLLQVVSVVYLFRRDAVEWLRSGGRRGVIDVTTFN